MWSKTTIFCPSISEISKWGHAESFSKIFQTRGTHKCFHEWKWNFTCQFPVHSDLLLLLSMRALTSVSLPAGWPVWCCNCLGMGHPWPQAAVASDGSERKETPEHGRKQHSSCSRRQVSASPIAQMGKVEDEYEPGPRNNRNKLEILLPRGGSTCIWFTFPYD